MTILFVIPPSPFLLDERVFMSLGVLRVAAYARMIGYQVSVLDLSGCKDLEKTFSDCISKLDPAKTVVAVTATTPQLPAAAKVLLAARAQDFYTILGGPHVTLTVSAANRGVKRANSHLQELRVIASVLVSGDGELAIDEAVKTIGTLFDVLAPIINVDNPKNRAFLTESHLNSFPFPARDLVDFKSYRYTIDGKPSTSLIGQLGCPMLCSFCSGRQSPTFRRIRLRSTKSILLEIQHLVETYHVRGFMFYDDELNINKAFPELLRAIIKYKKNQDLDLVFRGFIKSELFTKEQADLMAEAGFKWILSGFESGSSRILDNIKKRATVEDNSKCVDIAHAAGLKVKALMSLGHPGESDLTVKDTIDWIDHAKPDDADFTIITPYPGSPYYDQAVDIDESTVVYTAESGDRLFAKVVDYFQEADYYKGIPGQYKSKVWTDFLTAEQLVVLRDRAEARFRSTVSPTILTARNFDHSMACSPTG